MTENALAIVPDMDLMTLGKVLATSGYFQDARDAGQAIVKVLAGRELGLGAISAMTGIYIVKGHVTLSANLIAAAIKRSGRYSYKVLRLDNEGCEIEFTERGQPMGRSTFTDADAKAAGLAGDNWTKYRRNMHFARAMSNGAKWYCPDIFAGPIYTPDELGAVVDGETGEIVDMEPTPPPPPPTPKPEPVAKPKPATNGHAAAARPLSAEAIRTVCRKKAGWNGTVRTEGKPASEQQARAAAMLMENALDSDGMSTEHLAHERHDVLHYLFGVRSGHDLTTAETAAIITWLKVPTEDDWAIGEYATAEMAAVVTAVALGAGQQALPLVDVSPV